MVAKYLLQKGSKIFLWQRSTLVQRQLSYCKQVGILDNGRTWTVIVTQGHPHVLESADVCWVMKEAEGRISEG